MTRPICFVVAFCVFLQTTNVTADLFVPDGLNPGDTYQLAFVTFGTRNATSSDISDYNAFVQAQAELDNAFTKDFAVEWFAIANTATVDARDNAVVSAPVYLLDGTLVSTAGPTIYGGSLTSALDTDQFRNLRNVSTWTGSSLSADGTGFPNFTLGSSNVVPGQSGSTNVAWLSAGGSANPVGGKALYALSEQLTVVPEPAALLLWLVTVGVALSLICCLRCRKSEVASG